MYDLGALEAGRIESRRRRPRTRTRTRARDVLPPGTKITAFPGYLFLRLVPSFRMNGAHPTSHPDIFQTWSLTLPLEFYFSYIHFPRLPVNRIGAPQAKRM